MFELNDNEIFFIGIVLEGFLYGLYSGIFALYLHQASRRDANRQNIVSYSISVLYILSVALFVADITLFTCQFLSKPVDSVFRISLIQMTLFGCCDFIAQFILIYRCWIVWGRNTRIVVIPSILALAFLVTWLVGSDSNYLSSGGIVAPHWAYSMTLWALGLSSAVNALVTSLIAFKILKVLKATDAHVLGPTSRSKLRCTIFILIESGIALFCIQLARVVVSSTNTDAALRGYDIVTSIHDMLNGITPTIILVRTSMGLSFHDEKSMEEVCSLRFASNHSNPVTEAGSITIVGQDSPDDIDVQRSNDIDIVER